jgi:hypothetical protein
MVSRAADNVLEVRIGAAANASTQAGFSSLAQTHNVTFLLLVKREQAAVADGCNLEQPSTNSLPPDRRIFRNGPLLQVSSNTRMRNVLTGEELKTDPTVISRRAREVYTRIASRTNAPHATDAQLRDLLSMIATDDLADFQESLPESLRGYWQPLWTGLATAVNVSLTELLDSAGADFGHVC